MSRQRHGEHLPRSVNWLIFRGWPRIQRWLRVLHRVALFVALVLSLLAVLVTICQHGLSDRPRDVGSEPWTARIWAADRAAGVTIWAPTGRAVPDSRPARRLGRLLRLVLVLLVMLALASTGMMILVLRDGPILHGWTGNLAVSSSAATPPAAAQRHHGADGEPAPTDGSGPSALAGEVAP